MSAKMKVSDRVALKAQLAATILAGIYAADSWDDHAHMLEAATGDAERILDGFESCEREDLKSSGPSEPTEEQIAIGERAYNILHLVCIAWDDSEDDEYMDSEVVCGIRDRARDGFFVAVKMFPDRTLDDEALYNLWLKEVIANKADRYSNISPFIERWLLGGAR